MPYTVVVDDELIRVAFSGTATGTDLRAMATEVQAIERARPTIPNRLIDLTDMVATGMLFRLTLNLARGRRVEQFPNSFKSAILAPTADTARFARMFQQLNTNPQIDVQVFATLERAEAWLRAKD